ncbi:MAG: LamG-like jellyroll fold domain-containing protein [Eubacteriales bacterium]
MKKIISLLLAVTMMTGILASCGGNKENKTDMPDNTTETISTTEATKESTATTATSATTASTTPTTAATTEPEPIYTYEKEEGLVAYWAFDSIKDNIVIDVTGNGHDGTIIGKAQLTEGRIYKGIRFRSTNQSVVVKDADDLNFTEKDSFTIEVYYKWGGSFVGSNWPCLIQKGLDTSKKAYNYIGFWINTGSSRALNLGITGNGGTGTLNVPSFMPVDTSWHQAIAIQDAEAGTLSFYIDGVLQNQVDAINASSKGYDLYIGNNGKDGQFVGVLDEIKIYNYAKDSSLYDKAELKGVDGMGRGEYKYTDSATGESVTLPYRVYYPTGYDAAKANEYPILLFLHGYGECGTDNFQQIRVLGGPNALLDKLVEEDCCIIVAPQCKADPASNNWVPINKQWGTGSRTLTEKPTISLAAATSLLNDFLKDEKVDKDRIYVAGISMGGYGTWEILARNPELFAAAIPVCGAGIPSKAASLKDVAIWAFHGEADSTVPVSGTRDMENAIKAAGGTKMKATYFPGVGHNCWTNAYATEGLIEWLLSQSK